MSVKPTDLKHTVKSSIREEDEESRSSLLDLLENSAVFGRESFGIKEYMKIAASTPEEKKNFKDKRARQEQESEDLRRQIVFDSQTSSESGEHEKVVVKVEAPAYSENYDPMRSPEARSGTAKSMTPEIRKSPVKAPRPHEPRDSISTFVQNLENFDAPSPKANTTPKILIKILDLSELQVEGLKSDAKLYCVFQNEKQARATSIFKLSKSITLNEEFIL